MIERPSIALIFPCQYAAVAAMLGRAFSDDPLFRAMLPPEPDTTARVRRVDDLFRVILASHRPEGQPVIGVIHEGQVVAAGIIEQVERPVQTLAVLLRGLTLLPQLIRAVGVSGVMRSISVLDTLRRNRPTEPHIYLNVLGVEPALQGRHFGTAILDYLRMQAALRDDLAGVYLETATESNVAYYARFGYRAIGEIYPLGVRMWRMQQARAERSK